MEFERNLGPCIRDEFEASATAELGFALVDRALRPIAMDEGAASILSAISDANCACDAGCTLQRLPLEILEQIRVTDIPEAAEKEMRFISANQCYSARVCLMQSGESAVPGPWIILRFERDAETTDALAELSMTCRLTDREKEALGAIAIGLTSKEVAHRMNISPSTVKAFLRLIKIKTGARNRADIVARLLDPRDRSGHYQDAISPLL